MAELKFIYSNSQMAFKYGSLFLSSDDMRYDRFTETIRLKRVFALCVCVCVCVCVFDNIHFASRGSHTLM